MYLKILCLVLLIVAFSGMKLIVPATTRKALNRIQGGNSQSRSAADEDDSKPLGSPEDEMRARNEIKYYEKLHRENVERARETAELSEKIRAAYDAQKSFGQTERKNLERIEKLVRRIRSAAGGSSGDTDENNSPRNLTAALSRLAETSDSLKTGVEKTPRMVVSAAVIERSNELLQLLRYLRTASR